MSKKEVLVVIDDKTGNFVMTECIERVIATSTGGSVVFLRSPPGKDFFIVSSLSPIEIQRRIKGYVFS